MMEEAVLESERWWGAKTQKEDSVLVPFVIGIKDRGKPRMRRLNLGATYFISNGNSLSA